MEQNELISIWKQYDDRLEKTMKLNLNILKEMNMQKVRSSMNMFTLRRGLSLVFQLFVAQFLVSFIIDNVQNISLTAPAYLLAILTYIALIWNIYHLYHILTVNYGGSVLVIQKQIEKLRIQKLQYNKFIFYGSYPFVFLMGFTVLHIDLTLFPIKWLIPNILIALAWFPFCRWLIRKYNSDNLRSKFWTSLSEGSTLTPGSASKSLNNSLDFLREMKDFETSA